MFLVSSEQLELADADVVFSTSYGVTGEPDADPTFDAVRTLWESVPAVADGRQHWVDDRVWMLGIGLLGAEHILDDIGTLLGRSEDRRVGKEGVSTCRSVG